MDDLEFNELRNRIVIGVLVAIVFSIPILIFVMKSFHIDTSSVLRKLKKKEDMLIYLKDDSCTKQCDMIENIFEDKKISYFTIDIEHYADYDELLKRLDIHERVVEVPSIIYIENGQMIANMMDIKQEENLNSFIEFYKLDNLKK